MISGLTENSSGNGINRRTVIHVLLLEDIRDGCLVRNEGDFLCTAAGGSNGKPQVNPATHSDGEYGPYVCEVTCKQCIKAALRWQDKNKAVSPECVPQVSGEPITTLQREGTVNMQVAKNKYAVLDGVVMKMLGKEPVPFSLIMFPDVADECSRLADEERSKPMPFRTLDRRLQALGKAGKVQFVTREGWVNPLS